MSGHSRLASSACSLVSAWLDMKLVICRDTKTDKTGVILAVLIRECTTGRLSAYLVALCVHVIEDALQLVLQRLQRPFLDL